MAVAIFGAFGTIGRAVAAELLRRGHAVRAVGAGKLLFGTDSYLNPFAFGLGPILYARISDDDKRRILGLNMARLLERVGALPASLWERLSR